jgi:hypothetical protein
VFLSRRDDRQQQDDSSYKEKFPHDMPPCDHACATGVKDRVLTPKLGRDVLPPAACFSLPDSLRGLERGLIPFLRLSPPVRLFELFAGVSCSLLFKDGVNHGNNAPTFVHYPRLPTRAFSANASLTSAYVIHRY